MPEWLVERGIGETRSALIDKGAIVEARVELDGIMRARNIVSARLVKTGRNGVARDGDGTEYLLPHGTGGATEGGAVVIQVSRETIPGGEPWKRPLARIVEHAPTPPSGSEPSSTKPILADWDDLIEQARSGLVAFAGGELRISPTPAMTLIDVDGYLPAAELAVVGAREAARAIRRLDIGGSIGVDLPTAADRTARQAAAAAIDEALPQPFERTAVNGFGFVQIIRPRVRASLVELAQDRAAFEARALLRRAGFEAAGPKRLVAHPALVAVFEGHPDWLEALARQVGGAVGLRPDPALPMSGGYAENA